MEQNNDQLIKYEAFYCIRTLTRNSWIYYTDCEIGGLDCHVITTEYRTRVHCIHMYHLCCNALIHVIYSVVSGQYSCTILANYW